MWTFIHRMASPRWFYQFSGRCLPWLGILAAAGIITGLTWGLLFTPPDAHQGDSYRIIFLHVPSASLSLMIYVSMAVVAGIGYIWKIKLADLAASCLAPIGASLCALALLTGSIWGKPTWGTWWVWDARLTSMLILLFLYLGLIALREAFDSKETASRACAILSMVGVVNIPIIKFSVDWWNTLHQGSTLKVVGKSHMAPEMLAPLLISIAGFYLFTMFVFLLRMRVEIIKREQRTSWVRSMLNEGLEGRG